MTKQIRDILIFNEEVFSLNREILHSYFEKFPDHKPKSNGRCSALWRGYQAEFVIHDNQLIVNQLFGLRDKPSEEPPLLKPLEEVKFKKNLFWFSGLISLDFEKGTFNELTQTNDYTFLEIVDGIFIQKIELNQKEFETFKETQINLFKKTKEYLDLKSNLKISHQIWDDSKIDWYISAWFFRKYLKKVHREDPSN